MAKAPTIVLTEQQGDQLRAWAAWYFPGQDVRPAMLVGEMLDLAFQIGQSDRRRNESPAERRARLAGQS